MSAVFRTGHEGRKRDAEAAMADERKYALRRHVAEELAALRRDDPLLPARHFDEVADFLGNFASVRWRRPILAIVGGTNMGKTFLARHVLRQLADKLGLPGFLEVTVQGDAEPSLENFDHRSHAGAPDDLSAENLGEFQTNHWLADPRNVIVLNLTSEAWVRA